jgi:hypothetical protein
MPAGTTTTRPAANSSRCTPKRSARAGAAQAGHGRAVAQRGGRLEARGASDRHRADVLRADRGGRSGRGALRRTLRAARGERERREEGEEPEPHVTHGGCNRRCARRTPSARDERRTMRNRHLHAALTAFAEEAAWQLASDVTEGHELGFEVEQAPPPDGGRTRKQRASGAFYCYRPLTAEFIDARGSVVARLPTYLPAVHALAQCGGLEAYLDTHVAHGGIPMAPRGARRARAARVPRPRLRGLRGLRPGPAPSRARLRRARGRGHGRAARRPSWSRPCSAWSSSRPRSRWATGSSSSAARCCRMRRPTRSGPAARACPRAPRCSRCCARRPPPGRSPR